MRASATAAFAVLLETFHFRLDENELKRTRAAIAALNGPVGSSAEQVSQASP
jgi:hypothetical protein